MIPVHKNETYRAEIHDLTHEGMGVAKIEGFPIFIDNALPNEVIQFKVIKVQKAFAIGKNVAIETASPHRVPVLDKKGTWVGTMPLQHLSYAQQLVFKQEQVKNVMKKIAKMPDVPVRETIGAEQVTGYRNKAQIPVRELDGQLMTGFFRKNTHTLVPMDDFIIQDPAIDQAIITIRTILQNSGVQAYNEQAHTGWLRHIVVRRGYYSHQLQIVLVTTTKNFPKKEKIIADIIAKLPETVSIVQNINAKQTNVIMGDKVICLYGQDAIEDTLLGKTFRISSRSFYQVHPKQTERLYLEAIRAANVGPNDVVLDAYCGIGTIGLSITEQVKHVYGMEIVPDAIEMAKHNATKNGIKNATFVCGSAEKVLAEWQNVAFDVMIVDPPRKGLEPDFIEIAAEMAPKRIVYVSCNPATLARDLVLFNEKGYRAHYVQPVDMFPQTNHVEAVVLLSKA